MVALTVVSYLTRANGRRRESVGFQALRYVDVNGSERSPSFDTLGVTGSSPVPPIEKPCTKGIFVALAGDGDLVVARTDASGRDQFLSKNLVTWPGTDPE
jgi:hypothetical protein